MSVVKSEIIFGAESTRLVETDRIILSKSTQITYQKWEKVALNYYFMIIFILLRSRVFVLKNVSRAKENFDWQIFVLKIIPFWSRRWFSEKFYPGWVHDVNLSLSLSLYTSLSLFLTHTRNLTLSLYLAVSHVRFDDVLPSLGNQLSLSLSPFLSFLLPLMLRFFLSLYSCFSWFSFPSFLALVSFSLSLSHTFSHSFSLSLSHQLPLYFYSLSLSHFSSLPFWSDSDWVLH